MKIRLLSLALLFGSLSFGQTCGNTDFGCAAIEGYRRGLEIRMERERIQAAQAQQKLINAQTEAIRQQTEQLRIEAARPKQAPQAQPFSPGAALVALPEFWLLPMANRIRFIRAVEPAMSAQHTDEEFEKILTAIAAGR